MCNGREKTDTSQERENEACLNIGLPVPYRQACRLAEQGRYDDARQIYGRLIDGAAGPRLKALVANDLAVLAAIEGRVGEALDGWKQAIYADETLLPARLNRDLINAELALGRTEDPAGEPILAPKQTTVPKPGHAEGSVRVAIRRRSPVGEQP
jgi:hypothetical protein